MTVQLVSIFLQHPQERLIKQAVRVLKEGGIVVYPTDTIYGLGVDLFNKQALERVLRIKKASSHKLMSFLCADLKEVAKWAIVSNEAYKVMRRVLPGAYTFVLKASREIPKTVLHKRKTVGIRIPDSEVAQALLKEMGRPILSVSVPQGRDGYYSDPLEIADKFQYDIDLILDAGVMFNKPSTVVDFSTDEPHIIREGSGDIDALAY